MTSDQNEKEPFEGVRVDAPFISFRIGRGRQGWWYSGMDEDDAYERARRRVRARLGFYRHLATYAAVLAGLAFISLVATGRVTDFVLWLAAIWGALVIWQAFNVFVFPSVWSRETEERMIQEELRKHKDA